MSKAKNQGFEISDGYNILMLRTEEGDYNEVLNILNGIKQLDVNAVNKKGYSALALAVKSGFVDIVELLITRGADVNTRNNSGQSPLFLSCWCNYMDIVKLLLQYGAEINTTDQRGWSPLTIAAYHGNIEIVETLLLNNADVSLKDCFGKRAIHRTKDPKIAKMLQIEEVKCGLISNLPNEKMNRSAVIHTEPSLTLPADLLDKKAEALTSSMVGPKKIGSPPLMNAGSPATIKASKSMRQVSKPRTTNMSFETNIIDGRSPVRKSATPRAGETSIGTSLAKITSPKDSNQKRKPKELDLMLTSPLSSKGIKDSEDAFNEQMKVTSEKIHELIEEKIAFEVQRQVQEYQTKMKQGIDNIVQMKISRSFNELTNQFNNYLREVLGRLGCSEEMIRRVKFEASEEILMNVTKGGLFEPAKTQAEREGERKAAEMRMQRMERDILGSNKIGPVRAGPIKNGFVSPTNSRLPAKNIKTPEQIGKNAKATTETLLIYSKNKVNEAVQSVGKTIHNNLLESANDTAEEAEELSKGKMQVMMNNKFAQLDDFMANGSLGDADDKSYLDDERKTFTESKREDTKELDISAEEMEVEEKLTSPKVEKIRIPEKRYSYYRDKSELNREELDAVKEEEESAKDPNTVQDLKDSRLIERSPTQKPNLEIEIEEKIEDPNERIQFKTVSTKRDDDRSLNNLTPYSESSGTLSSEFRLDGLKNYFGKKDAAGKSSNQLGASSNTNRSQNQAVPGHEFGFTNTKTVIQYDFDE